MDNNIIHIVLRNRAFLKTILRTQAQLVADLEKRVKNNVVQLLYIKVDEYVSTIASEYEEYTQNDRKLTEILLKNNAYLKTILRTLAQIYDHLFSKDKGIITQVIFSKVDIDTSNLLKREVENIMKEEILDFNHTLLTRILDIQSEILGFLENRKSSEILQILTLRVDENYEAFIKVNEEQSETVKNIIKMQFRNQSFMKTIIGTLGQLIASLENRNKIEFLQALSRRVDDYMRQTKNMLNLD
ncbi:MAG: hypothetical protein JXB49_22640 [Bacteroidales bacterium]|nr:hypothetical protein [Bacteroidales bacterium]